MIGSALLLALGAQAAPAALPPAGKWTVDYAADCTLSRGFRASDGNLTFGIRPEIVQPGGDLILALPARAVRKDGSGRGALTLEPGGRRFAMRYTIAPPSPGRSLEATVEPDEEFWTALPQASELTVDMNDQSPHRFAIGRIDRALDALKACQDAQLRFWGADPTALVTERPGSSAVTRAFGAVGYPDAALRARAEGRVVTLLKVDRSGKGLECRVVRSSGNSALDLHSCARAVLVRYPRAVDGRDVRWAVLPIRWSLPVEV